MNLGVVVVMVVVMMVFISINLQLNSSQIGCCQIEDSLTPLRVVEYHGPPFPGEKGMHRKQSSVCRFKRAACFCRLCGKSRACNGTFSNARVGKITVESDKVDEVRKA